MSIMGIGIIFIKGLGRIISSSKICVCVERCIKL